MSGERAARVIVRSLADLGVDVVVISPGSRSTPLVWQIVDEPRLRAESVVDERDAAFWAVARAKITGRPTAILCTSGSAAANYFPAIVEAAMSGAPLLVLTADRPLELQQSGASQTIDQLKLYGSYVRHFAEVDLGDESEGALRALRRTVAQAVYRATAERAGPVHVDVRARKPLEPSRGTSPDPGVEALLASPITHASPPAREPAAEAIARFAAAANAAERPLVVCGPLLPSQRVSAAAAFGVAERLGAPIFAETTSGLRFALDAASPHAADLYGLVASTSRVARVAPDLVLQIGATPTSASIARLLEGPEAPTRFVVAGDDWMDPQGSATELIFGNVGRTLASAIGALPAGESRRSAWLGRVSDEVARARRIVLETIDADGWGELAAVAAVLDSLPPASLLAVGNSLPVREVDLVPAPHRSDVIVWSQRGASGIDGLVAGAAGAADASGRPTTLLIGDVSLLHDIGGLALASRSRVPLRLVVLNNGGGRIFEQLPIGARDDLPPNAIDQWTTPHDHRFAHACAQFGVAHVAAANGAALSAALTQPLVRTELIEVSVAPDSPRLAAAALRRRLEAAESAPP